MQCTHSASGWTALVHTIAPAVMAGLLIGCGGGGQYGVSVDLPAHQRSTLAATDQTVCGPMNLSLPQTPFNIHWRQSSQTPGLSGQARGDSHADPAGQAGCSAQASGGGDARGEFQLSHAFTHAGAELLTLAVKLTLDYTHQAAAGPVEQARTESNLTLNAFLRQSDGRILHRQTLAAISSDDGPGSRTGSAIVEFETTLEPGKSYDLVVAGRASATAGQAGRASASIAITRMTADLQCRPMPTAGH